MAEYIKLLALFFLKKKLLTLPNALQHFVCHINIFMFFKQKYIYVISSEEYIYVGLLKFEHNIFFFTI